MAEQYDQQASNNKRKLNELLASQEQTGKTNYPVFNKSSSLASNSSTSTDVKEFGKNIAPIKDEAATLTHDGVGIIKVDPKPKETDKYLRLNNLGYVAVQLQFNQFGKLKDSDKLKGNFGPVKQETPPTGDLQVVQGQIPRSLNGMMVRNGPNPVYDPPLAFYSWMDGDSMLHAIKFKDGKAIYASRYVQTSRYLQEHDFEGPQFYKFGDLSGSFGLFTYYCHLLGEQLGGLDTSHGFANADTGLIYHNGMLMALEDFDKPYVIKVLENGDLETLGINGYNTKLTSNFTPHPKKDPETGELFTFGCSFKAPYTTYNVVSKDGIMSDPVPITTSGPTFMHDFGLTENYVIFMDLPFCFNPENMVTNHSWIFHFDTSKKSRFGILPRYAKNEEGIKWFEFDGVPFYIFHNANAWQDREGNVILISCVMKPPAGDTKSSGHTFIPHLFYSGSNKPGLKGLQFALPQLFKLTFNMKTGQCYQEQLSTTLNDYPRVNEKYTGRKTRYVYTSIFDEAAKLPSIVKYDLGVQGAKTQEIQLDFGGKKYGSEVVFVPSFETDLPLEEDDGYLLTYVHDEDTNISYAYVISAQKMETVAVIKLPSRVPYGFHAIYMTERELQGQISNLA